MAQHASADDHSGSLLPHPIRRFAELESAGGIVLILCTIVALVWANSPWAEGYEHLWHHQFGFSYDSFTLEKHLSHWINDGLMVIFFFVVGLEIKREVLVGELSSLRKSILPMMAAVGGMVVPAGLFALINLGGGDDMHGWGIPMATDIAFAIGILTLLGNRVPLSLKVFLTALAIIDDLGAVLVIAIFYTSDIGWSYLGYAGIVLVFLMAANRRGVRAPAIYGFFGVLLWYFMLKSGVHATIAGVLLAMFVPARAEVTSKDFVSKGRGILGDMEEHGLSEEVRHTDENTMHAIHSMRELAERSQTPLQRMEHALHSWTTFAIIPIFALANAGVSLDFEASAITHGVTMGIFFGLVVGKLVGVFGFSYFAVKVGLATLPEGVRWGHIIGLGFLAGIGFTMSLFITNLAYTDEAHLQMSKLGILAASAVSGLCGFFFLRAQLNRGS